MKLYSVYKLPGLSDAQRAILIARLGRDVNDTEFGPQSFEACMDSLDAGERADAQWEKFPETSETGAQPMPYYTETGFVLVSDDIAEKN